MKRTIYKYHLRPSAQVQRLELSRYSRFRAVQVQHDEITLWFDVPARSDTKTVRSFLTVPTGGEFENSKAVYLGTVQLVGGAFVWHIYEVTSSYGQA